MSRLHVLSVSILITMVIAVSSHAAVTVETASANQIVANVYNISVNAGTNANRMLLVGVWNDISGRTVDSITYGTSGDFKANSPGKVAATDSPYLNFQWFWLASPDSGTNTLSIDFDSTTNVNGRYVVLALSNASQSTPTFSSIVDDNDGRDTQLTAPTAGPNSLFVTTFQGNNNTAFIQDIFSPAATTTTIFSSLGANPRAEMLYVADTGSTTSYTFGYQGGNATVNMVLTAASVAPIPEPASLALVAAGGLLMLPRRRRSA